MNNMLLINLVVIKELLLYIKYLVIFTTYKLIKHNLWLPSSLFYIESEIAFYNS